jgi:hypothetical protein
MSILYKNHDQYPDFILIRNFTGEVDVDEIMNSWDFLLENKLITNETKGVINNLTECELKMNIHGFDILMDYLKKHGDLKRLKLAVICDDPGTIVFPMLGESDERELKIKPFSTEKAAVNWIIKG